jgi:hypothetical protein
MQCATHPSVETELACGKCGKAICPRCLVHTPVGARCRECANVRRLPQFEISPLYLARGVGAGLASGAVLGAVWGYLLPFGVGFFLGFLVGLGLGYAVGEAVSLATNRKVGPQLQAAAIAGVVVAYLVRSAIAVERSRTFEWRDVMSNDIYGYIVVLLAVVVAMNRLRR